MPEQNLFVYGTLHSGTGSAQQGLLHAQAVLIKDASINTVMFDLVDYPGIKQSIARTDRVNRELYGLKPEYQHELLAQLDEYEACSAQFSEPHEFKRELVSVKPGHKQTPLSPGRTFTTAHPQGPGALQAAIIANPEQ